MKLYAVALAAALIVPLAPASAREIDGPGAAAVKIYNWCMRLPTGSSSECSCVAGFFAGATEEDEYQVIAAFVDFIDADGEISDPDGVRAAVAAHQESAGLSDERLDELIERFATFDVLGEKADAICMPIETHAESPAADLPPGDKQ